MAAGGFTFAFVRPVAKLFTSWSVTTPARIAGAPSLLAPIRKADCVRRFRARVLRLLQWIGRGKFNRMSGVRKAPLIVI